MSYIPTSNSRLDCQVYWDGLQLNTSREFTSIPIEQPFTAIQAYSLRPPFQEPTMTEEINIMIKDTPLSAELEDKDQETLPTLT